MKSLSSWVTISLLVPFLPACLPTPLPLLCSCPLPPLHVLAPPSLLLARGQGGETSSRPFACPPPPEPLDPEEPPLRPLAPLSPLLAPVPPSPSCPPPCSPPRSYGRHISCPRQEKLPERYPLGGPVYRPFLPVLLPVLGLGERNHPAVRGSSPGHTIRL